MADQKNRSAIRDGKGNIIGYDDGTRKATNVVTTDEELAEKVAKQKADREAAEKKPQGLGALASALKKATPTPTPKK